MAKAYEQKIGLGIDFAAFDRDLRSVADRIEAAGKGAAAKAGGLAGELAVGRLDSNDAASAVASVGVKLATGMADGIRQASGLMLGFTAHVDKMLDRLAGAAITIFRRIDDAMKFPAFDAFFRSAQLKLSNFSAIWRKPLSDLDIAVQGGFGGMVQNVAKIAKVLVDQLASAISGALKSAVSDLAVEFARVAAGIRSAEGSAADLLNTTEQISQATAQFPRFNPIGPPGTSARPFPGVGRRIGHNVDFTAPEPPAPKGPSRFAGAAATLGRESVIAFQATGQAIAGTASILAKFGAALISVPLRAYVPFARFRQFLGDLGDVGGKSFRDLFEKNGLFVGSIMAATKAVGGLLNTVVRIGTLGVFGKAAKDAATLNTTMAASKTSADQLAGAVKNVGGQILAAFGIVGVISKFVDFLRQGVLGASDLNEAVSRSKVVFGDSFGAVEAQAKAMTDAFGISRQSQLDVASGFGAMAQGAGMSEAASASLANQMTKMAADLSSSVNIPFEEAGEKIRSALAGESEPLRQFGANISDANVKAYALASGVAKSSKAMTDQHKITARAALIMQGLSYAQNDLENTSNSASNQFRKAGGGIQEFGIRIGELLLPVIKLGAEAFNTLMGSVLDFIETSRPTLESWMGYVVSAMEGVGMVVRNLGTFWTIAQLKIGEFISNSIAWFAVLGPNFAQITAWLGRNWWNLLVDMASATQTAFQNLNENAVSFGQAIWAAIQGQPWEFAWKPLLDGFQATTEALPGMIRPELISVGEEVDRLWAEIGAKEAARAAAMANQGGTAGKKPPGPPMAPGEKPQEYRLASAVEVGSKEAYSIIAKSQVPRGSDPAKEGVRVAKDSNAQLREIAMNTRRNQQPQFVTK